jgi:hypothetical protein
MSDFAIPHVAPLRFVKRRICATLEDATVEIGFDEVPSLGMLIEAATQSSSGIVNDEINGRIGFLVTLKNIKLLQTPQTTTFQVKIHLDLKAEDLRYLSFTIYDEDVTVVTGSFVIILQ